jgi:hypothetical protein
MPHDPTYRLKAKAECLAQLIPPARKQMNHKELPGSQNEP